MQLLYKNTVFHLNNQQHKGINAYYLTAYLKYYLDIIDIFTCFFIGVLHKFILLQVLSTAA